MSDSLRPERASSVFDEVVGLGPEARAARLAALDEGLRRDVESLLAAADLRAPKLAAGPEALPEAVAGEAESDTTPHAAGPPAMVRAPLADRYVLEREIGRGGMARVYRAMDVKHHRQVAIKVFDPALAAMVGPDRFLREIEIAANLNHPHILPLFDSGAADGFLYYVMPLMEGESLRDLLAREGRLPVDRAVSIAREVAEALAYAHDHGLVHRDVKPANVLMAGGHSLLADFGVARALEAASGDVTATGSAPGTPFYMSPEQLSGEAPADARSDIYSLGCVLYEMLAGHRPFAGQSAMAVLAAQVRGAPPPLDEGRSDIPPALAAVVRRALATEATGRFENAAAFAEALTAPERGTRPGSWVRSVGVGVAAAVLGLAAALGLPGIGASADLTDQKGSVVVLPFRDAIQTPNEIALLIDLAGELTRQLNRWDSVRAVPQVSLSGVAFDVGIEGPVLQALDDGRRIARALGVETLITLNVRIRGDSADVTATQFAPRGRTPRGSPLESRGPRSDPFRLAAGIAHQLLGLSGPIDRIEHLRRHSSNAQALLRYADGLRFLERWKLTEAERAFRSAVVLDSTFAMAHHYLAVDLYWQAARGAGLTRLGPEAARLSRTAVRHAEALAAWERDHVVAFNRFLEGDYDEARERYRRLIARDSTDVYAWLLRGIVEFRDPWLVERPDGSLWPRADWNAAVRSFTETTRLSPDFHLGYGHLFDITESVLATAYGGSGWALRRPASEVIPPWEPVGDPTSQEGFYLAYQDSLVWLSTAQLRTTPAFDLADGAIGLLERSLRTLRRWAAYAPNEARPQTELVRWTLRQRSLLEAPQATERADSLARTARGHAERALSLSADTLPSDLVQLGNLYLATGEARQARRLVEDAISLRGEHAVLPASAGNAFLHGGQWRAALELLESEPARRLFLPDPQTGELLGDGGAEPLVQRLVVLGSAGVEGAALDQAFAALEDLWARAPEGTAPVSALRAFEAPRVAPALVSAPEVLTFWRPQAGLTGPFWEAVNPSAVDALSWIRAALAADQTDVTEPARSYLLGLAALRGGDPRLALRLFARLDSIPLAVERRDAGWGLRSLSLFRRGQAYDALGDGANAAAFFQRFLETRVPGGDSTPFQSAALGRLALLRQGG